MTEAPAPAPAPVPTLSLPGLNVLEVGAVGTGKTYAIHTLVKTGITPFIIFTEQGWGALSEFAGSPPDCKIHWQHVSPSSDSWDALLYNAKMINSMSNDALQKMAGIGREHHRQYMQLLQGIANYKCDRCGKEFGDATEWGPDRAFVLDGLSGVNIMSMNVGIGSKPIRTLPDWGVAMDAEERLIQKLTNDTKCWFVLIAHLERIIDEVAGSMVLGVSALGKKLGPTLPRYFDEVIQCRREGAQFFWATATLNVDLKTRSLPLSDKLEPDFRLLIDSWKKRGGKL